MNRKVHPAHATGPEKTGNAIRAYLLAQVLIVIARYEWSLISRTDANVFGALSAFWAHVHAHIVAHR
tara:strand:- start:6048 stop:6248 length:201 start_codon:yes stop_codon:yes gene_type:complete